MVSIMYDLFLNSDILIQQESNARHSGKQTGPFKLLAVENKTCKIQLPSGPANFRIITVKSYLQKHLNTEILAVHNSDDLKSDLVHLVKKDINNNNQDNIDIAKLPRQNPAHTHKLSTRF